MNKIIMGHELSDGEKESLKCSVESLEYDFDARTGYLKMSEGQCCNMSSCIAIFQTIDLDVAIIKTYAGDKVDTTFKKNSSGWEAFK